MRWHRILQRYLQFIDVNFEHFPHYYLYITIYMHLNGKKREREWKYNWHKVQFTRNQIMECVFHTISITIQYLERGKTYDCTFCVYHNVTLMPAEGQDTFCMCGGKWGVANLLLSLVWRLVLRDGMESGFGIASPVGGCPWNSCGRPRGPFPPRAPCFAIW